MKIIKSLKEIVIEKDRRIGLTIGNFDGFHKGHQFLIDQIKKNQENLIVVLMTFDPHPKLILGPKDNFFAISEREDKIEAIANSGVDYLVEIPFSRDFSTLKPDVFLRNHLFVNEALALVVIGHDFGFGVDKKGDLSDIQQMAISSLGHKIEVIKSKAYSENSDLISSTLIREKIIEGDFEKANLYMDRAFRRKGIVLKGEGRGRKIGFPTANIKIGENLIYPSRGVYATKTLIAGKAYDSITNIGFNPTFKDDKKICFETHILDFDSWIYGETLEVHFFKKIRNEIKFSGPDALVDQITKDIGEVKAFFNQLP
jgi:riboflavin kinase/FMN adenylyltransferase